MNESTISILDEQTIPDPESELDDNYEWTKGNDLNIDALDKHAKSMKYNQAVNKLLDDATKLFQIDKRAQRTELKYNDLYFHKSFQKIKNPIVISGPEGSGKSHVIMTKALKSSYDTYDNIYHISSSSAQAAKKYDEYREPISKQKNTKGFLTLSPSEIVRRLVTANDSFLLDIINGKIIDQLVGISVAFVDAENKIVPLTNNIFGNTPEVIANYSIEYTKSQNDNTRIKFYYNNSIMYKLLESAANDFLGKTPFKRFKHGLVICYKLFPKDVISKLAIPVWNNNWTIVKDQPLVTLDDKILSKIDNIQEVVETNKHSKYSKLYKYANSSYISNIGVNDDMYMVYISPSACIYNKELVTTSKAISTENALTLSETQTKRILFMEYYNFRNKKVDPYLTYISTQISACITKIKEEAANNTLTQKNKYTYITKLLSRIYNKRRRIFGNNPLIIIDEIPPEHTNLKDINDISHNTKLDSMNKVRIDEKSNLSVYSQIYNSTNFKSNELILATTDIYNDLFSVIDDDLKSEINKIPEAKTILSELHDLNDRYLLTPVLSVIKNVVVTTSEFIPSTVLELFGFEHFKLKQRKLSTTLTFLTRDTIKGTVYEIKNPKIKPTVTNNRKSVKQLVDAYKELNSRKDSTLVIGNKSIHPTLNFATVRGINNIWEYSYSEIDSRLNKITELTSNEFINNLNNSIKYNQFITVISHPHPNRSFSIGIMFKEAFNYFLNHDINNPQLKKIVKNILTFINANTQSKQIFDTFCGYCAILDDAAQALGRMLGSRSVYLLNSCLDKLRNCKNSTYKNMTNSELIEICKKSKIFPEIDVIMAIPYSYTLQKLSRIVARGLFHKFHNQISIKGERALFNKMFNKLKMHGIPRFWDERGHEIVSKENLSKQDIGTLFDILDEFMEKYRESANNIACSYICSIPDYTRNTYKFFKEIIADRIIYRRGKAESCLVDIEISDMFKHILQKLAPFNSSKLSHLNTIATVIRNIIMEPSLPLYSHFSKYEAPDIKFHHDWDAISFVQNTLNKSFLEDFNKSIQKNLYSEALNLKGKKRTLYKNLKNGIEPSLEKAFTNIYDDIMKHRSDDYDILGAFIDILHEERSIPTNLNNIISECSTKLSVFELKNLLDTVDIEALEKINNSFANKVTSMILASTYKQYAILYCVLCAEFLKYPTTDTNVTKAMNALKCQLMKKVPNLMAYKDIIVKFIFKLEDNNELLQPSTSGLSINTVDRLNIYRYISSSSCSYFERENYKNEELRSTIINFQKILKSCLTDNKMLLNPIQEQINSIEKQYSHIYSENNKRNVNMDAVEDKVFNDINSLVGNRKVTAHILYDSNKDGCTLNKAMMTSILESSSQEYFINALSPITANLEYLSSGDYIFNACKTIDDDIELYCNLINVQNRMTQVINAFAILPKQNFHYISSYKFTPKQFFSLNYILSCINNQPSVKNKARPIDIKKSKFEHDLAMKYALTNNTNDNINEFILYQERPNSGQLDPPTIRKMQNISDPNINKPIKQLDNTVLTEECNAKISKCTTQIINAMYYNKKYDNQNKKTEMIYVPFNEVILKSYLAFSLLNNYFITSKNLSSLSTNLLNDRLEVLRGPDYKTKEKIQVTA